MLTLLDDWIPEERTLYLVYADKRDLPGKAQVFIEFIREQRNFIQSCLNAK